MAKDDEPRERELAASARIGVLEARMEERHTLYLSQFAEAKEAVKIGLAAQKELVQAAATSAQNALAAALTTQKESSAKTEAQQTSYNVTHNDLVRKMDDQYKMMMPRTEVVGMVDNLKEKISALEKSNATGSGKSAGLTAGWAFLVGGLGLALALWSALK